VAPAEARAVGNSWLTWCSCWERKEVRGGSLRGSRTAKNRGWAAASQRSKSGGCIIGARAEDRQCLFALQSPIFTLVARHCETPSLPAIFHVAKLGISCGRSSRYRFRLFCSNTASPERYRSVNTSRVIAAKKNLEAPAKPNVRRPTAKIPPGLNLRVNDRDDHEGQNFKSYKSGAIPSRNPVQYAGRSHIHDHLSIKPRTFRRTARGVDPNNLVCACSQLALVAQQRVHPRFPPPRHQLPLVRDMQTHQRSLPVYTTL